MTEHEKYGFLCFCTAMSLRAFKTLNAFWSEDFLIPVSRMMALSAGQQ